MKGCLLIVFAKYTAYTILRTGEIDLWSVRKLLRAQPSRFENEGRLPWRNCIEKTVRSANGNLVNVGNADDGGVNVDSNDPRNSNGNLGVRFSRSVQKSLLI
jgi:hypothetical protein